MPLVHDTTIYAHMESHHGAACIMLSSGITCSGQLATHCCTDITVCAPSEPAVCTASRHMSRRESRHLHKVPGRLTQQLEHDSHLLRLQEFGHVRHGARHKLRGDNHEDDF